MDLFVLYWILLTFLFGIPLIYPDKLALGTNGKEPSFIDLSHLLKKDIILQMIRHLTDMGNNGKYSKISS